eukprot:6468173-Amphidinium_carterae.1
MRKEPSKQMLIEEARQKMLGKGKGITGPYQEVYKSLGLTLELEDSFTVLTEKDMKKYAGVSRISKQQLKGIPTISLHTPESGKEKETMYLFSDEDAPGRKLKVKSLWGTSLESCHLRHEERLWKGQAPAYADHQQK